jgi:hypothetical protein
MRAELKTKANIHLDADAYQFAAAYAHAKGIALGVAVSELLRRAEQKVDQPMIASPRLKTNSRGLLVKARTGRVVTPETVRNASEDDPA